MSQTEQPAVNNAETNEVRPPRIARLGDRAVAAFLDALIPLPLLALPGTLVAIRTNATASDGTYSLSGGPALLAMTMMFSCWMLYAVIAEYQFNGTLGKHIMGIRVRTVDARPITLFQALIRNLARVVDLIGFYLVGFLVAVSSNKSQRVGDRLATTAVFEWDKSERLISALLGAAVFAVGIFIDTIVNRFAGGGN